MYSARIKRIIKTKSLSESGRSPEEIARSLNLSIKTIKGYQKEIEISSIITKKNKFNWRIIIDLVLFLIALGAIWFTYVMSSPINLEVWHNITEEDGGKIYIYGKNNDWFRSTGDIDIYRLEVNPYTPHLQLSGNDTLKPGEEKMLFSLLININESEEFILSEDFYKPFSIPMHKLYFIMEKISISYKIMCDNCRSQGIVRRVPNYANVPIILTIGATSPVEATIRIYSWKEYELGDLYS